MPNDRWYDSNDPDRFARGAYGFGLKWVVILILTALVIGAAIWSLTLAFNTGTANVRGRAGAYQEKESSTNRVFAQAHFHDMYAAVQKDIANIKVNRRALAAEPSAYNRTNLTGVEQVCNSDVETYNADAKKYLLKDFRDADLPPSIELSVCTP